MACTQTNGGLINPNNLPQTCADAPTLNKIFLIVFAIIGALAVLMIVISGTRYIFSQGEPQKVAEIKRHIAYALFGLIIVVLAAAIVNFVLGGF